VKWHHQDFQSNHNKQDGIEDVIDNLSEKIQPVTSRQRQCMMSTLVTYDESGHHHGKWCGDTQVAGQSKPGSPFGSWPLEME
jgi:hypothetical protein